MRLGMLTLTNSIEMCDQALFARSAIVILLDDEIRSAMEAKDSPDIMSGSIILPPFTIMAESVDNIAPPPVIDEHYLGYLHTTEPQKFITGIMAMLVKGMNVMILLSSHEVEFDFIPRILLQYLALRYGLTPLVHIDCLMEMAYNWLDEPMYHDYIVGDLFLYDYMDANTLLMSWSAYPLSEPVIKKLIWIFNPAITTGTFEEYASIFNRMKDSTKESNAVPIMPFVIGGNGS